VSLLGI